MNIAIAGFGVEGQESYAYWSRDESHHITIVDERLAPESPTLPEGVSVITGEGAFSRLNGFDMVIRTPSLPPRAITTDGKVWSGTNEFFAKCPAPIIGVTGSKGKGTTSSLIASTLEAAGKKVWLVGNIGVPALSILDQVQPGDIVVYELSSFQLWDLEKSPHTAVVLFIEQDHLDVHQDMSEYVEAKAQIARWQTDNDILVYDIQNEYAQRIAAGSRAQKVAYPSNEAAHVREHDEMFCYGEEVLCSVHELRIPGDHNKRNALAAIDAIWSYTQDPVAIKTGLNAFRGLPHRLAHVATVNDVEYYDDSIATTATSAIAGLRSFDQRQKVIILGGSSKGADFTELAEELTRHDVHALLIGDEAVKIAQACDEAGFSNYERVEVAQEGSTLMQTIIARAAEVARPGAVVILSPAAASFGLFANYVDRGDQFVAAVKGLSEA